MMCIHPGCRSERLIVVESRDEIDRNPKRLGGLNIRRRKRRCPHGHIFWTIEIPETEFEYLRSDRGRLEAPMGGTKHRG